MPMRTVQHKTKIQITIKMPPRILNRQTYRMHKEISKITVDRASHPIWQTMDHLDNSAHRTRINRVIRQHKALEKKIMLKANRQTLTKMATWEHHHPTVVSKMSVIFA